MSTEPLDMHPTIVNTIEVATRLVADTIRLTTGHRLRCILGADARLVGAYHFEPTTGRFRHVTAPAHVVERLRASGYLDG